MRRTALVALCILFCCTLWAQIPVTGFPPFGSFESGGFDNINRQNLNVMFQIPLVSLDMDQGPQDLFYRLRPCAWLRAEGL